MRGRLSMAFRRYGLTIAFLCAAVLLSELLSPVIPHSVEYIFLAAVVGSAWLGGRGPGLLAALTAPFLLDYFFLPPLYTLGISVEARPYVLPFLLSAVAAAWMSSTRASARKVSSLLKRSEEKFRRILANQPDVAWTVDQNGRFLYIGPRIEGLTGYRAEEIRIGGLEPLMERVHGEDRERLRDALGALFAGRASFDAEFRFERRDGSWIWLYNRAVEAYEQEGVRCADGVISDVSQRKQAELNLRAKTAFLEALTDATLDGLLVVDETGRRILHNRRFGEVFDVPAELLRSSDDAPLLRHVTQLAKDVEPFLARVRYLYGHPQESSRDEIELKNGKVLDRFSSPVIGESGQYFGRIWTFRDITERRRTEMELRSKTAFLEAQANCAIDGILVVDAGGRRLLHNPRLVEIFNIPPHLLATPDQLPLRRHILRKLEDSDRRGALIVHLNAHPDETHREEIALRNGNILDMYSAPVRGRDGDYYGRVWTFRDITERKRREDTLRQLSAAVEQSPVSVVITDREGRISYVNRKFTDCTGYASDEVLGRNPRLLNSGYSPPDMYRELWTTVLNGGEWRGEFRNRKKNGELYWETALISPIVDANGSIEHLLAVKEDITERRALESELRQAQKLEAIGQLAAGIAHEINTPIQFVADNLTFLDDAWAAVLGLLDGYSAAFSEREGSIPPETRARLVAAQERNDLSFIREESPRAIAQSLEGVRRVATIVCAMKEFSYRDGADRTLTDLNNSIASTITIARNEWKYVAEVETDFDPALPPVICYRGEMNQVVLNLLVNAAHAIRDRGNQEAKGRITVRTRERDAWAEISISDTGVGIPEGIRNRIFEPFFTTREVGSGTGQGLALAYAVIVKKHQGRIWFETETGKGTTFFVLLPIGGPQSGEEGRP
ncbi:MAG: PAS domain S-box protein [Acidobacteriaceae bacterium]